MNSALKKATLALVRERKKPQHHESEEQQALVTWASYERMPSAPDVEPNSKIADYLYAIPNGGARSKVTAAILKAEGVKPGVLDLHLPVARGRYIGLWVEMKWGKNGLTEDQVRWKERMERAGHKVVTCWSWPEAQAEIQAYLRLGRPTLVPSRPIAQSCPDQAPVEVRAVPKPKPVRSPKYLAAVASLQCAHCGRFGYSQAAHPDEGKGMGTKADDNKAFPLCTVHPGLKGESANGCHEAIGQGGLYTKQERRDREKAWGRQTFETLKRARRIPMGMPTPKFEEIQDA